MKSTALKPVSLVFIFSLFGLAVQATQTNNIGIHAVPVPGKVTIDGKLDDWDLSGQVFMCYDIETLKDVYSAKVAAMYDSDNLYLAVHWADLNPMCNSHDPHYQGYKAWAGDCVQFRVKTDKISNVDCWYYASKKEPSILISYGKDLTHPSGGGQKPLFQTKGWQLSDGAEEAFLKDADGKGYVQEIKLPWKLITDQKKYQAGDAFNLGVELLWGAGDWPVHRYADNMSEGYTSREFYFTNIPAWGTLYLEPKGNLHLPEPAYVKEMQKQEAQGPIEITYDLPEDARVTLAINDADGKRVRNLVAALPRQKGKNTEHWDGLDDNGKPVAAGKYNYQALYHHGIHTNYVMSFANPGHPSWDTADSHGAFYADHTAPVTVATAGDYVALGCPIGEAGKPIIVCDLNGQRLWGQANRAFVVGGQMAMATDGKTLWISQDQTGTIYRVEVATGLFSPWNRTSTDTSGASFKVLDLPVYDAGKKTLSESLADPNLTSISVNDHLLVVAFMKDGVIKLFDKETGDTKSEIKIDAPRAVVFDQDGSLVALSKGQLVRATADGKITPFASDTFPDGYGLAIDSRRNIYLSVRGADQNVTEFSPDGKLVREIGKNGGRPLVGKFDDAGMRNPAGIAIDSKDRLWVTEETHNPKRTSVWNTADGTLATDFVGTTSYAGAGGLNPADPTMAFSDDTVYQLDWKKGTYRPTWSLGQKSGPDDLFPPHVYSLTNRVMTQGDSTYVFTGGAGDSAQFVNCTMYHDGKWRSAAVVGIVPAARMRGMQDIAASPLFAGHTGEVFSWTDKNGDGLVQAGELTFATPMYNGKPLLPRANYWGQLPDGEGTVIFGEASGQLLVKFPVKSFASDGVPVYDVANPTVVPLTGKLTFGEGMIMGGKDGRTYVNQDPLTAFDKDGRQLFTYPNPYLSVHGSHNATSARPGLLIGPSSIYGVADMGGDTGEVFYLNGNLGQNFLFTWDGLYIQSLFKDGRGGFEVPAQAVRGESFDDNTAGGESFGGNFVRASDGKTYLVQGGTDARILEITGLDGIKRFSGSFTYTPEQFARAQDFNQKIAATKNVPKTFTIPKATAPVVIDGKVDAWPELNDDSKALIDIQESAQTRFGRVAARYDDQNLYLAYHVFSPNDRPHNAGQDAKLLFKTGDVVDLMLGPDPQDKKGRGNLRLLFSVVGGQPTAVLYEQTVPGTAEKDRMPFSSPWRTIYFDRVTQPVDVKVTFAPYPGHGGGYFAEVAIPWSRLGVKPAPGLKLKADFGILSADSGGTITVARQYWSNKSTGLVNDVPGEAQLDAPLWGEITLQ